MNEILKIIGFILIVVLYFWFQRKYGCMRPGGGACGFPKKKIDEKTETITKEDKI